MTLPIARITTVLAPAFSHWLADLNTVKDELSIDESDDSNDGWLARAIGQVSRGIERYCKRPFAPEFLQDVFQFGRDPARDGIRFAGVDELALARWPLLSIVSVIQSLPDGNTRTLALGTDFIADMARGRLLRLTRDGQQQQRWEALPVTVQYTAGYGALVTETQTVPSGTPFQVTVNGSTDFSCDQEVSYAGGAALQRVAASPAQGQYVVGKGGVYTFAAADEGQPLTFAYATVCIPADLVEIVLRLVTGRFRDKDRNPSLIEENTGVGTRRWWFGGAPGQKGPFPPDIQGLLDDYRVPTVA